GGGGGGAGAGEGRGGGNGGIREKSGGGGGFDGTAVLRDFRITDFTDYQAVIGHRESTISRNRVEQKTMNELWHSTEPESIAEFHWRLTLIFSVVIMALMVVPLSEVNPRQGRVLSMLPAMLLYLVFFLLQSSLRSSGEKGKVDPLIAMWTVNGIYFALALLLNAWDTLPMRKLRARFKKGVA
ncbi:LptF/LptG family permease, partial [Proteus mirabilis]